MVMIQLRKEVEEKRSLLEVKTKRYIWVKCKLGRILEFFIQALLLRAVNQIMTCLNVILMLEILRPMKKMVKEDRFGLMAQFMRDGGQMIKPMDVVV